MKPTIGRVVHYVNTVADGRTVHEAAIVSMVHTPTCVNLHVMVDAPLSPVRRITSVLFDETCAVGTWHWPERE